jgi:hypothetical protein
LLYHWKQNIATKSGIGGQRGYVSLEQNKKRKEGDLKEFWHFGQYVGENSKYASEYQKMW